MRQKVRDFATDYTAAWCSQQPIRVAEHFAEISDPSSAREISNGFEQAEKLAAAAKRVLKAKTDVTQ